MEPAAKTGLFYLCSTLLKCILYSSLVCQVYHGHASGSFARFVVFALRVVCESTEAYITHNIFSNHKSSLMLSPPVLRLSLRSLPFANVDLISYNHTDKQRCNASGNNRHPKAWALSRWICALLQSGVIHHHPSQIWLQETDYTLLNLYGDIILLSSAFFIGFRFESHCIYTAISCIVGLSFLKCVFGFVITV